MTRSRYLLAAAFVVVLGLPYLAAAAPTVDDARTFLERANTELLEVWTRAERAAWVNATFITGDTELIAAQAAEERIRVTTRLIGESRRYDDLELPPDLARQMTLLRLSLTLAAPPEPELTAELTRITTGMEGFYGRAEWCPPDGGQCRDLGELSRTMAGSRDEAELRAAWVGWRSSFPELRDDFTRYVELANQGARSLGYPDLGAMWRSKYDMPADDFAGEVERLWLEVKPLYDKLHCYVRARLAETYGAEVVPADGPIPAHLLGNMWAQEWANIEPLVAPSGSGPGFDLSERLTARGVDEREMVRYGERFFTSLGFEPLPATFWERSLFTKPRDREVVCHAVGVGHRLGRRPADQDVHRDHGRGLRDRAPRARPQLLPARLQPARPARARQRQRRLPRGGRGHAGAVDHAGVPEDAGPDRHGARRPRPTSVCCCGWRSTRSPSCPSACWSTSTGGRSFRARSPPSATTRPGGSCASATRGCGRRWSAARPTSTRGRSTTWPRTCPTRGTSWPRSCSSSSTRALCQAAGWEGPLNRCSIYGNAEAGKRLQAMLEMGTSRPWPEALEAVTGQRTMSASALLEYFAPLEAWLDRQNAGRTCGW